MIGGERMIKTCRTCINAKPYKVNTNIFSTDYQEIMEKAQDGDEVVFGVYNGQQGYSIFRAPYPCAVTCGNKYSTYHNRPLAKGNRCPLWATKRKHEKTGLSIFDNYECEGQLELSSKNGELAVKDTPNNSAITPLNMI